MPKETRREYMDRIAKEEGRELPSIQEQAKEFNIEPTHEIPHLRCPVCGMMSPEGGRTLKSGKTVGIGGGPYHPIARVQKYGASIPAPSREMRDRPGLLWWEPETELTKDQRTDLLKQIYTAFQFIEGGEK